PTSLLKEDHEYNRMFNANNPIRMYIQCAKIMLKIDEYLRVDAPDYAQKERTNIRFHLGMYCVVILSGAIKPSNQTISEIKIDLFTNENMSQCLAEVWEEFVKMRDEEFDGRSDRVAKSRRFDEALKNRLLLKLGIQQQMKFDELNETQIFEQK
ncbi:MAG: hypothetical protein KDE46_11500, partial [Caldilineaceae bacterium]|nr:hypothetical protein [Caldilineaceae bacterium]